MRLAILWTALSGYLNACLRELASREEVDLFVAYRAPKPEAPFRSESFDWISNRLIYSSQPNTHELEKKVEGVEPDALLISGWHVPAFRSIALKWRARAWRVMAMDNCWRGSLRQRIAVISASRFLHPLADALWVPGQSQMEFARRLGFDRQHVLQGLYSCHHAAFACMYRDRCAADRAVPRAFLYIGRMTSEKGITTLLEAYQRYRGMRASAWPLMCCGTGPHARRLQGVSGVDHAGFVQPENLPEVMGRAGCLILPSRFEPWGVVLHEAASAGLVLLASDAVGSAKDLVIPGKNGYVFQREDAVELSRLMQHLSATDDAALKRMSHCSHQLSHRFTPVRWADTLLRACHEPQTDGQPSPVVQTNQMSA